MKTRLNLMCALVAGALNGGVTDAPRLTGSLADKADKEDIGKPMFPCLSAPDCEAR